MAIPNKLKTYVCPLHKTFGQGMAYSVMADPKWATTIVNGSQCKNNCSEYKNNRCPKFKVK